MKLLNELNAEWPAVFALQPKTTQERQEIIEVQKLKKSAAKEIERLLSLINEHNSQIRCDKKQCGYEGYDRRCLNCPEYWRINI